MTGKKLSYPTPISGWQGFLYSVAFGLFVTLFLWFFEPFDINVKPYSFLEISFFGFISFGVFFLAHTLLPMIFSGIYKERNWTIYSQIIFYVILCFMIATFNGLYLNVLLNLNFSWSNYLLIIIQTFAVGIIPITLYVLLSYAILYRKIVAQANLVDDKLAKLKIPSSKVYTIQTDIKNETFNVEENTFLYASSSGNYIEVFIAHNPSKIYRMSMAGLEQQLSQSSFMIRCHRSYFVNMKQVHKVTGNAQGLKLWLKGEEQPIPVSRKYLEEVKSIFAKS